MSQTLSEPQSAALLDILSHYDTYAEIRDFRLPGSLKQYGPPFTLEGKKQSTSPALQALVSRFLLTIPGLRDLPEDFWKVQCYDIIESFEEAELSESYDKGVIGSRKTLATAISALIEYPIRGTYGGFAQKKDSNPEYDLSSADDLSRAFRDFLDQAIYGTILEDLVKKTSETDQLSDHTPMIQAVHEFVLVNMASFMHYILILSPKGQYLLKLIENVHKLIPYMMVRQTLRIGNVASMINGMVKIGLAKMSVASFTNWMGLTATEDEGMNLLQQIISTVLNWDMKDLESRATKIEKDKNGPSKEQLQALKDYQSKSRDEHEKLRKQSQKESISIVVAILKSSSTNSSLADATHKQALEYLSVQLSIRDRKEIIQILCRSIPDHFTTSVRALVTAYEPVIRQMHNAIDLSETVYDFEAFTRDMIKLAKVQPPGKDGKSAVPTVGDFVALLKKHQLSCHKFVHQCCKNGKEVTSWYLDWAKQAASQFRRTEGSDASVPITHGAAGDITATLNDLFNTLDESSQKQILPILDAQTAYLEGMHDNSKARLAAVLRSPPSKNPLIAKIFAERPSLASRASSRASSRAASPAPSSPVTSKSNNNINDTKPTTIDPSSVKPAQASDPDKAPPSIDSDPGPGAYLSRWQDLLDNTLITPLTAKGEVKTASSKKVMQNSATDVDGTVLVDFQGKGNGGMQRVQVGASEGTDNAGEKNKKTGSGKPDISLVVELLSDRFREVLAERSCYW